MSANLQKIGITSNNALTKFAKLETQSKKTARLLKDMGGSVGSLRAKLQLLKQERDWIPASNLKDIRKYNTEINRLTKKITKLETINGSKFKRNLKSAFQNLPGAELLSNPVAQAGVALFTASKMAFKFSEGMAKVNTTAQLSDDKIQKLGNSLLKMGKDAGANLSEIPDAYEKILSQTGDVALSQDILKSALKGSKAGFTDVNVVSGALAQSLSLIGKENANASDVLDTFFAAKRVGAGEFKDFANYMPSLISSGKALGVTYKQTAGLFAFMTGKGFAAERSATLLENAYSALGKTNIQKNLSKAGVSIFDRDGAVKDMGDIFKSLQDKLSGMSDKKKSNFLAKIGLVDKEARSAFMVLSGDSNKLKEALSATGKASGETDKAFEKAKNPMMAIRKLWTNLQFLGIKFGGVLGKILVPAISALLFVTTPLIDALGWFFDKLASGDAIIVGITSTIAILTLAYKANAIWLRITDIWTKKSIITTKLKAFWSKAVAAATNLWTGAQWLLNIAMEANPIGLIIAGVALLIAGITWLVSKIEGWGEAWSHTVKGAKLIFKLFIEGIKGYFTTMVNGIMIGINKIKVGFYKFKDAVGLGDSSENQKIIAKINADTEARKKAIVDSARKVKKLAIASASEFYQAGASLKWKESGIAEPQAAAGVKGKPVKKKTKEGDDEITKTNKSIATGGKKSTYITITLEQLIGVLNIKGNDFKDSAKQLEEQSQDALLRVLAMATTAGS